MKRIAPHLKADTLPLIILTIFLVLFSIGLSLDEPSRVLEQAWRICYSCIGIG